jgi:hypothetical protein
VDGLERVAGGSIIGSILCGLIRKRTGVDHSAAKVVRENTF